MTRLERDDPYLRTFDSVLEGVRDDADGTWWRLRESAFYATGGGQPHDEGTLHVEGAAAWRVTGVESDDDGTVWHRVEPTTRRGAAARHPRCAACDRLAAALAPHAASHRAAPAVAGLRARRPGVRDALGGAVVARRDASTWRASQATRPWRRRCASPTRWPRRRCRSRVRGRRVELHAYPLRRPPKVSGRVRLVRWATGSSRPAAVRMCAARRRRCRSCARARADPRRPGARHVPGRARGDRAAPAPRTRRPPPRRDR
jgi:hypothetical protein